MSQSATAPASSVSTGADTQPPLLHPSNITGAPASTAAGLGLAGMLLNQLATQGLPTSSLGWMQLAFTGLMGLSSIFMRA